MSLALKKSLAILEKHGQARRAPFSIGQFLRPQLAMLVDHAPDSAEWIHEKKYDGYRIFAHARNGEVQLWSRNGKNWSDKFRQVRQHRSLQGLDALLDGEVVVLDAQGNPSFSALQDRLSQKASEGFVYYVFDVLWLQGYDVRQAPLLVRKKLLSYLFKRLSDRSPIRLSPFVQGKGPQVFRKACRKHWEGILSKQASAPYRARRGFEWVKVKCVHEDEFIIAGFTDPGGSREGFGSLLLAYYDRDHHLHYAGRVGTGFNDTQLQELRKRLRKMEIPSNPSLLAADLSPRERRVTHFVKTQLVAQVRYTEWTASDHRLRHPVFLGLREDKDPSEITYEA